MAHRVKWRRVLQIGGYSAVTAKSLYANRVRSKTPASTAEVSAKVCDETAVSIREVASQVATRKTILQWQPITHGWRRFAAFHGIQASGIHFGIHGKRCFRVVTNWPVTTETTGAQVVRENRTTELCPDIVRLAGTPRRIIFDSNATPVTKIEMCPVWSLRMMTADSE